MAVMTLYRSISAMDKTGKMVQQGNDYLKAASDEMNVIWIWFNV